MRASIPDTAVSFGGMVRVSSGSTMAVVGQMLMLLMRFFVFFSLSLMLEYLVTSLPVPEVVGMAINGRMGFLTFSTP